MTKSIDEKWIATRIKMQEFDNELQKRKDRLPEGVYMHGVTMEIENRFSALLQQAWIEIANAQSILEAITDQQEQGDA